MEIREILKSAAVFCTAVFILTASCAARPKLRFEKTVPPEREPAEVEKYVSIPRPAGYNDYLKAVTDLIQEYRSRKRCC